MERLVRRLGVVVSFLGGSLGAVGVTLASCTTPSAQVDGGDLLGVFERDAAADASSDAAGDDRRNDKKRSARGESDPSLAQVVPRKPGAGSCLAVSGNANRAVTRTVGRPACRDAQILEWQDPSGAPRYACVIAPRGAEARAPLPLVIHFHGEFEDPTSVDRQTGLRKLGSQKDLTGDPAHAGFVILAVEGRALRVGKLPVVVFDADYTGPDNVDVLTTDHFVDELMKRGLVDRRRVYTLGSGSGGSMAALYAMMRADRVAAFASYAGEGPSAAWACSEPPPPAMMLYRACDDTAPCDSVERWLRGRDGLGAETIAVRLGEDDREETNCALRNKCTKKKGGANHRRWPKQREGSILSFFAKNVLAL